MFLQLNFKGPHPSLQKESENRRLLLRPVHVVVVQPRQRNVQKQFDACAKFCFANLRQCLHYAG